MSSGGYMEKLVLTNLKYPSVRLEHYLLWLKVYENCSSMQEKMKHGLQSFKINTKHFTMISHDKTSQDMTSRTVITRQT